MRYFSFVLQQLRTVIALWEKSRMSLVSDLFPLGDDVLHIFAGYCTLGHQIHMYFPYSSSKTLINLDQRSRLTFVNTFLFSFLFLYLPFQLFNSTTTIYTLFQHLMTLILHATMSWVGWVNWVNLVSQFFHFDNAHFACYILLVRSLVNRRRNLHTSKACEVSVCDDFSNLC